MFLRVCILRPEKVDVGLKVLYVAACGHLYLYRKMSAWPQGFVGIQGCGLYLDVGAHVL